MKRNPLFVLVVLAVSSSGIAATGQAAEVSIDSHENDAIVPANPLTISGTANGGQPGEKVQLKGFAPATPAQFLGMAPVAANGSWAINNVNLPVSTGPVILEAHYGGQVSRRLIHKGSQIAAVATQKIFFDWSPAAEEEVKKIAEKTLEAQLPAATLSAFLSSVKSRTLLAFSRAYADFDVEVVAASGAGVHVVKMLPNDGDIFGQSPLDCGNVDRQQESEIWVGTYRSTLASAFPDFQANGWGPMRKDDSWQTRAIDVGEALGRTSAHEVGHSLGMVGSNAGFPCGWMRGCDGGHNCDLIDSNPAYLGLSRRFNGGFFIMDPGGKTRNSARLAEPSPLQRAVNRQPAVFSAFNRSYLRIVHP